MRLTSQQIERFDRDDYLFFPSLFTPAEIRVLTDEVPRLFAQHRPENVREKAGGAVRCAPISPRTCTVRRSPGLRATRAWSSR
jgi:hypothetical protein